MSTARKGDAAQRVPPNGERTRPLRVGTMGPLTCSAEALEVYLASEARSGSEACFHANFDQVYAALLDGSIDEALVPHCHPIASELLFDPRITIEMGRAFDKPNPPLYLARRPDARASAPDTCAALPTLWPLVSKGGFPAMRLLPCVSNPAAAQALVDGRADRAITNAPSLAAFRLEIVAVLKHVIVRWLPLRLAAAQREFADDHAPLSTDHRDRVQSTRSLESPS